MTKILFKAKFVFGFTTWVWLIFIAGCAQQVAPSGGQRDTTPPKILNALPNNFSLQVNTKILTFEFDEYVVERSLLTEMIISPPLKTEPKFYFKGKRFYLEINEPLLPNTTYQINFGKGLVDYHEGNPLDSNIWVFSTGNYLDSLKVSGKLIDAFTLQPAENKLVMLFEGTHDSLPKTQKPTYFSRTDEAGNFQLNFLKPNTYKLFALDDKNANYIFDLPNEQIAFFSQAITLPVDTFFNLQLFEENNQKQFIKKVSFFNAHKLFVVFNLPAKNPSLIPQNIDFKNKWFVSEQNQQADSLIYWLFEPLDDTLKLEVFANDSLLDTVDVFYAQPKKLPSLSLKPITPKPDFKQNPFTTFTLNFNFPLKAINDSLIKLYIDSVEINETLSLKNEFSKHLVWQTSWKPLSSYQVLLLPNAVTDLKDSTLRDTISFSFEVADIQDYANLKLNIAGIDSAKKYILELHQSDFGKIPLQKVQVNANKLIEFKHLKAGNYQLKVFEDLNHDSNWTTGKYDQGQQPEKVFIYSGGITIRPGFDSEIEWNLNQITLE